MTDKEKAALIRRHTVEMKSHGMDEGRINVHEDEQHIHAVTGQQDGVLVSRLERATGIITAHWIEEDSEDDYDAPAFFCEDFYDDG